MKTATCTANRYFQSIRMLILQYIKVNFSELLSASPVTSPASPVLTYSFFNICVWTNTLNWFFCAADFLKDRTAERKLVVSLKQVSRNLIPAVSPIHHLPSCSTFSSDILINSCYAMLWSMMILTCLRPASGQENFPEDRICPQNKT